MAGRQECVERWHEKECLWRDGRNGNVCGETSGMGNVCGEMTGMGMCVERWKAGQECGM